MTITYALVSVISGAVFAALAWIEAGPVMAAIAYVGVGSMALFGMAFLLAAARLDQPILDPNGVVNPGRNRTAS